MHALGCLTLSPGLLLTHGLPWRRTSEDLEAVLRVNVIGAYYNFLYDFCGRGISLQAPCSANTLPSSFTFVEAGASVCVHLIMHVYAFAFVPSCEEHQPQQFTGNVNVSHCT